MGKSLINGKINSININAVIGGKRKKNFRFEYQVKKSTIEGAGNGLFYMGKTPLKRGTRLSIYGGKILPKEYPVCSSNAYIYGEADEDFIVDALDETEFPGKFANDSAKPNAIFKAKTLELLNGVSNWGEAFANGLNPRGTIDFKIIKLIKGNSEIFLNYGNTYWKNK